MRGKRSMAFVLSLSLAAAQLACGGLFGGEDGQLSGGARPAPHFEPGFNLFSPEQDIELGRRSAQEIAQQVPIMQDEQTVNYVRQLGARLASRAPGHKFPYQFNVVATKDINAFALPGGFIFVNAGAIVAAKNEGELAGVLAHEITHVALRHGTNQASKAYVAQTGIGILGSVFGGGDENSDFGRIVESIGGAGANIIFLKFGRTAEKQADLEGARIMAEAGYDPRDMAGFFQTLQSKGGQGVPEFLSDHPDPGNRIAAINQALPSLPLSSKPVRNTPEFQQTKARLTGNSAALNSTREPARIGTTGDPNDNQPGTRPPQPSASLNQFEARDSSFSFQYPSNWDALVADDANMIFAPKGAYGQRGQAVYVTHGIFIGAVAAGSSDLEAANAAFVRQQVEMNADFRVTRAPERYKFRDREGFATVVAGPSAVTGVVEVDVIYTTATADGRLFYLITMAPEDEFQTYKTAFDQIVNSLQLAR